MAHPEQPPPPPPARGASTWLPYRQPPGEAAVRLFCFPPAGAGASLFRRWPAGLPAQIEVCAVQLPGRETRWREPRPATLADLLDQLADALSSDLDRRYALFGHSFGALVGYTLARRLRERGQPGPVHLFVSAAPAPDRLPRLATTTLQGDAVFAGGGVPEGNPELHRLAHRLVRADLRLAAGYRYAPGPPLDCPVTAFGGRQDTIAADELTGWRAHTTGPFALRLLPGGHLFIRESPHLLTAQLAEQLATHLRKD